MSSSIATANRGNISATRLQARPAAPPAGYRRSSWKRIKSALESGVHIEIGVARSTPGTVSALIGAYLSSIAFKNLAPQTQRSRRGILERFRHEHGGKRVAMLQREHVQKMLNAKANTPSAARNFLNTLRVLMAFAVEAGIRADDPTLGVKRPKIKTTGWRTWTEEDIAAFEAEHPVERKPGLLWLSCYLPASGAATSSIWAVNTCQRSDRSASAENWDATHNSDPS